jgi:hypothetical protein
MPFGNSYFVTILVKISNDLYGIYIEKPVHLWERLLSSPGAVWEISIENGKDIKLWIIEYGVEEVYLYAGKISVRPNVDLPG